jgi:hypothetical protein
MTKLYNISEWNEQSWWNTGGTRDKKIYLNPEDNNIYYFKQSFKKGQRDYKHEFWSEIIASQIGKSLGIDILEYDIAIRGNVIGCISKNMINVESEELIEGGKYLHAFDNTFNPEDTKLRKNYDFDLILKSLIAFGKEIYIDDIIKTIVFDALIGNSDRHQENWAIINIHSGISDRARILDDVLSQENKELPTFLKKIVLTLFGKEGKSELQKVRLLLPKTTRFAPIYDSGCSFGRELSDEKIENLISNDIDLKLYIEKGAAEIHWEKEKISHFKLIENLLLTDFKTTVLKALKNTKEKFEVEKVRAIVNNIDNSLLNNENLDFLLPSQRKEFIIKSLTLRFSKLKEVYERFI